MSSFWSIYVIALIALNIVAVTWLLWRTSRKPPGGAPEQETTGHGHDRAARQGKAYHGDIERHIPGHRGEAVMGDELIDCRAIADQCLERDVAVQAEPIGQRDEGPDDEKRREPPVCRAGWVGPLVGALAIFVARCVRGHSPIVCRRVH